MAKCKVMAQNILPMVICMKDHGPKINLMELVSSLKPVTAPVNRENGKWANYRLHIHCLNIDIKKEWLMYLGKE